ncbi:DUF2716 domain-containing protein [Streptomyces sp. NPDC085927]|uniref:DUF2716 domain-containing protein n=1 Tax=Streptomyces sp. NPDC085927 TaxID=3365738 RepID=UPI0037D3261F
MRLDQRYSPWRQDSWLGHPLLAETDGSLRESLLEAGFTEVATVRSYHWSPPGSHETTRPAQFLDWLHDDGPLWDRFHTVFDFKPSTTYQPAITDPVPSAVWHLHSRHRLVPGLPAELDAMVQRGLPAATEPGEFVYWLGWNHDGYRYSPRRTDVPGRPPRPGKGTYPNGDYYLHLTEDLRLGTLQPPMGTETDRLGSGAARGRRDGTDRTARRGGQAPQLTAAA